MNMYLKNTHTYIYIYKTLLQIPYISEFSYFATDNHACHVFPSLSTFFTNYFNFEEEKWVHTFLSVKLFNHKIKSTRKFEFLQPNCMIFWTRKLRLRKATWIPKVLHAVKVEPGYKPGCFLGQADFPSNHKNWYALVRLKLPHWINHPFLQVPMVFWVSRPHGSLHNSIGQWNGFFLIWMTSTSSVRKRDFSKQSTQVLHSVIWHLNLKSFHTTS